MICRGLLVATGCKAQLHYIMPAAPAPTPDLDSSSGSPPSGMHLQLLSACTLDSALGHPQMQSTGPHCLVWGCRWLGGRVAGRGCATWATPAS